MKQRILAAMDANRVNYPSDAKHAQSLGISSAVYSQLKQGQTDRVLSESNWISMARRLGVELRAGMEWKVAKTATFKYIWAQLSACQHSSLSAIMLKTKRALVRKIAREFGVGANGKFADIYDDLVFYIRTVETPIIVLDEAGDLQYEAFLELKALWNATERCCAWYMMGADGLRAKIERSVEGEKVGYAEMLSRYGDRFCKVTPDDGKERQAFLIEQARVVAEANAPEGEDAGALARKTGGALRRVYTEIEKLNAVNGRGRVATC